jgi:hypothetical protein
MVVEAPEHREHDDGSTQVDRRRDKDARPQRTPRYRRFVRVHGPPIGHPRSTYDGLGETS